MDTCSETCPICLNYMKEDHICKELSCGHKFHFVCFKKMVYHNNNFFIKCPMCRKMNYNVDKPFKDEHKRNILMMCHSSIGKTRCLCKNKNGAQCKNKSLLMNYGKCHTHNSNIIKKEYYKLYSDYMYHILCSNYEWMTIIYLLDVGKKIMIKYLNENSSMQEIIQYYYRYLNDKDYRKEKGCQYMNGIYDYYGLEKIPRNWLDYCINKNIII